MTSESVPGRHSDTLTPTMSGQHPGVIMTGHDRQEGTKAFYIHIEARPDKADEVKVMLRDILGCVEDEPATGPWYGVQYSETTFGVFEVFPSVEGRRAHVNGGGGDIFRDLERLNDILVSPAHVFKLDVLMSKQVFTAR